MNRVVTALIGVAIFLFCQEASAQICRPVAQRTAELGCWIIANQPVGKIAQSETYGHLDAYLRG